MAMRHAGAFNVALCNVDRCGLAPTSSAIFVFTMAVMGSAWPLDAVGGLVMVSLAGHLPDILATVDTRPPLGAFTVALCNVAQLRSATYW